jgi:hypothetical protein
LAGCGAEPFLVQVQLEADASGNQSAGSGGANGSLPYIPSSIGSGGAIYQNDAGAGDLVPPSPPAVTPGGSGGSTADALTDAGGAGGSGDAGASRLDGLGGISGTGGAPTVDGCARSNWTIDATMLCNTASCVNIPLSQKEPKYAIDGDMITRYTSGRPQGSNGPETVTLTFPHNVKVGGLRLRTSKAGDGAAAIRIQYAATGTIFTDFTPAVSSAGGDDLTIIFPATTSMKALRITQTGMKTGPWWSIHELTLSACQN